MLAPGGWGVGRGRWKRSQERQSCGVGRVGSKSRRPWPRNARTDGNSLYRGVAERGLLAGFSAENIFHCETKCELVRWLQGAKRFENQALLNIGEDRLDNGWL